MGLHVKRLILQRHNHRVNVNVNAIPPFMARSTLVCFDWAAFKAPSLKAKAVGRHHSINSSRRETTKIHFLLRLTFGKRAPPPSGTELSNGQAAKLAVKDMMDDRPRMYDSPPATYTNRSSGGHFAKTHFHIQLFPSIHTERPLVGLSFINAGPTILRNSALSDHQFYN